MVALLRSKTSNIEVQKAGNNHFYQQKTCDLEHFWLKFNKGLAKVSQTCKPPNPENQPSIAKSSKQEIQISISHKSILGELKSILMSFYSIIQI